MRPTEKQQQDQGWTENPLATLAGSTARTDAPRDATVRRPFFNALATVARRKLNAPPDWEWCALRVLTPTDDTLVEGGIPNRRKDGRKRKGYERWRGVATQTCVVTAAEEKAARAEYEATTGKCAGCAGCGETLASISVRDGARYRPCRRCGGSGRAQDSAAGSVVLAVDPASGTRADSRSTPNTNAGSTTEPL